MVRQKCRKRRVARVGSDERHKPRAERQRVPSQAAPWLDAVRTQARPEPHLVPTWDGPWLDVGRTVARRGTDRGATRDELGWTRRSRERRGGGRLSPAVIL